MHQTALDARHRALGARMVPYAGWEMPVQYSGIIDEHQVVRTTAGLFDLTHMGELWFDGPGAGAALDYAVVTTPSTMPIGKAQYSMICTPEGTVIDDLIIYRIGVQRWMVVANASNVTPVVEAMKDRIAKFDVKFDDATMRTSLVAIQGPKAAEILQPHIEFDLPRLKYYAAAETVACGVPALLARTGYTGEDGFELFVAWNDAVPVWDTLLAAGLPVGLKPVGLGARDSLRLEAGMPLYGQELSRDTTPFEAGLGRVVKFDKPGDFVGRAALERAKGAPRKQLVGLKLTDRGIARTGYPVYLPAASAACGSVTSGTSSPTLGYSVAMAFVPVASSAVGTVVEVGIRNLRATATIVPLPFYKRST